MTRCRPVALHNFDKSRPHKPLSNHAHQQPTLKNAQEHRHAPYDPVDHQERPRPRAHLLAPIHAAPCVHRDEAAHEAQLPEVEHRRVPDVRERAEVEVPERARDGLVRARAPEELVLCERVPLLRELGQLAPEVLALLRGYLRSLWVGSELVSVLCGR